MEGGIMSEFEFVHDATTFNLQNALSLALCADLAYKDKTIIEEKVKGEWKFSGCQFIENRGDDTQLFVMSNNNVAIVAFRGSEPNIKDWGRNFTFPFDDGPFGGDVHSGFYSGVNNVWEMLTGAIKDFNGTGQKTLWFTGHSLGGALATLAVAKLREMNQSVSGLYTFGQPRVGDEIFADGFNSKFKSLSFRFVNNNDIVTRVPPSVLKFSHIGTFKYFNKDGKLKSDISYWERFYDRLHGRVENIFKTENKDFADGIKDHNMKNYIRLIGDAI